MLTLLISSVFLETGFYTSYDQHPINLPKKIISHLPEARMNQALKPAVLGVVIAIAIALNVTLFAERDKLLDM